MKNCVCIRIVEAADARSISHSLLEYLFNSRLLLQSVFYEIDIYFFFFRTKKREINNQILLHTSLSSKK